MRVLIATSHLRRIGGVETYLSDVVPALVSLGHGLAVVCDGVISGGERWLSAGQPTVTIFEAAGAAAPAALEASRLWRPDVVYAHGMIDPDVELAVLSIAPSVFFLHQYYGACISGAKRFAFPELRACDKPFGPMCLARYLPRRCGGLNPTTMLSLYRTQRKRLRTLRTCAAVVTHSFHMLSEYSRYGLDPQRLHRFPYYSAAPPPSQGRSPDRRLAKETPLTVGFVGRVDDNKGVPFLLDAAPIAARVLGKQLRVIIIGDGPTLPAVRRLAKAIERKADGQVAFDFQGWLNRLEVVDRLAQLDLVVVPSVWPEPFGLVGVEAGHLGIPVAAFDVGGIPGWLVDGVNGYLAPANPPRAQSLAMAIVACLTSQASYDRLSRGAIEMAQRFTRESHMTRLVEVLHFAAAQSVPSIL